MEDRPLNPQLREQQNKLEQARKKRDAAKSLYLAPEAQPLLDDLMEFIETQRQGCIDKAATTESEFISTRSLHMMLMSDIIKTYIKNQRA